MVGVVAEPDLLSLAAPASRHHSALKSLPGVLATTALVLVLAGMGLQLRGEGASMFRDVSWFVGLVGALGYAVPGAQVMARSPGNLVAPLCLGIGLVYALSYTTASYGTYGLETVPGSLPGAAIAQWCGLWIWALAYSTIPTVLLLVAPHGTLLSPRWRPALWVACLAVLLAGLGWAVTPYERRDAAVSTTTTNPVGAPWGPAVLSAAIPILLLSSAAGLIAVVLRYRRATGIERDQASWVVIGALATGALLGLGVLLPYGGLGQYIAAAALVPLPLSLGVAVLRHGLWDVDTVMHRSIVYASLVVVLIGLHAALLAAITAVAGRGSATSVLPVAAVAAAAVPLHSRLRRAANRLVYGDRDEPWAIVSALSSRLEAAPATRELLEDITGALARGLRLANVAVDVAGVTVESGPSTPTTFAIPLVRGGRRFGVLRAAGRAGDDVGRSEREVLTDFAPHISAAIEASTLAEALQRSREEIVRAREEERRSIRHELHDGVGPTLAAVALELEAARDIVGDDPDELDLQLDRLAARLNDVVNDLRRVVDGLRPAALDDLGLLGALRAQFARLERPTFAVSLVAHGDIKVLPAAVDLAIFRIASEAVTNALRHSGASSCRVNLEAGDDQVLITIEDDGSGIPTEMEPGIGLLSMQERADELGGTFQVITKGTGTTVRVRLPATTGAPR